MAAHAAAISLSDARSADREIWKLAWPVILSQILASAVECFDQALERDRCRQERSLPVDKLHFSILEDFRIGNRKLDAGAGCPFGPHTHP